MATTRPFAYNTGSTINGTEQVGNLAIGVDNLRYDENVGGVKWWMGPDEDLGYIIAHQTPDGTQPNPIFIPAYLGFWRSKFKTEESFVELANWVAEGQATFTNGLDANIWLNNNGYWSSFVSLTPTPTNTPTITNTPTVTPTIPENLLVYLDSGNLSSYPGSGSTWTDLQGGDNNATLINSPIYSSNYSGILSFDDTSLEYGTIPNIGNLSNWTVEVWFRLTTALTGKVTSIISNEFDLVNKLNFSIGTNNAPSNYNLAVGYFNGAWRTTTGFIPQTNVWYQVVGTYDGSTIRQYVNGSASGGTLNYIGTSQSGGEIRLMRRWDSSLTAGNLVDGDLAIVKIYNIALSGTDILQSYNDTYTRFIDVTPTPTNSSTPTNTPTQTPTVTPTPTNTQTSTLTNTPTNTQTSTLTNTPTNRQTPTPTVTPTNTATTTATNTPTTSMTPTKTVTPTVTNTPTPTQSGYLYYRWQITEAKTTPPNSDCVQSAEFVFQIGGVDQSMAGVTVTNPSGNNPVGETPPNLVDNNLTTKALDLNFVSNGNVTNFIFQFSSAKSFNGYRWATANDEESRDPKSWTIAGSNNGTTWTTLHTVSGFIATTARDTWQTAQTY